MNIISGMIPSAQKVVVYGPEGIGKSTFASKFPEPIFIDVEGSTKKLNVARTPRPSSWSMLMEQVKYFKEHPMMSSTLVIDTADWAERLCITHICAKADVDGIASFGYGNGYVYLEEEFGRLLNLLEEIVNAGTNVVFTAHAQMRKFEQPEEVGAYDRWELKLQKKTAPLLKEWADTVLFANYKTMVVNVDNQGARKGKNKARGGSRVMYTTHHPCWDAKNRDGLAEELPFDFAEISAIIPGKYQQKNSTEQKKDVKPEPPKEDAKTSTSPKKEDAPTKQEKTQAPKDDPNFKQTDEKTPFDTDGVPKALLDLMKSNNVAVTEIQRAVADKGYYPIDTPMQNYNPDFINGVLIGAWAQVFEMIKQQRLKDEPF